MVRAVENIEMACYYSGHASGRIVGRCGYGNRRVCNSSAGRCRGPAFAPFNFPIMIPFWFMPYALACGNTYIVKPSEKVPMTMARIFELFEDLELPAGVLNMLHGSKETVDAILSHPKIAAISFVGSTNVAKYIYQTASANGKRVQAQGGAKKPGCHYA